MEATKSDLKNYLTWVAAQLRDTLEMFQAECLTCFGDGAVKIKSNAFSNAWVETGPAIEICPACRGTKTRELEVQTIVLKMAESLELTVKEFEKKPCPMLDSVQPDLKGGQENS